MHDVTIQFSAPSNMMGRIIPNIIFFFMRMLTFFDVIICVRIIPIIPTAFPILYLISPSSLNV